MTNTTTDALRTLATDAITAPRVVRGVNLPANGYAVVEVTLPDGSRGTTSAADVLRGIDGNGHVVVRQGGRADLWHHTQLAA